MRRKRKGKKKKETDVDKVDKNARMSSPCFFVVHNREERKEEIVKYPTGRPSV